MAKRKFDLITSLQGLFLAAEKLGDFSGCSSLARVIRDLTPPEARTPREERLDLSGLSTEDVEIMCTILAKVPEAKILAPRPVARPVADFIPKPIAPPPEPTALDLFNRHLLQHEFRAAQAKRMTAETDDDETVFGE